jgi:hypothetical protein
MNWKGELGMRNDGADSIPFNKLCILKWQYNMVREVIRFTHRKGTGKHKIRNSKLETRNP